MEFNKCSRCGNFYVTEGNVYSDTTRNSARKAALEINEIYHTVYQEEFGIPIEEIGNEIFGHAMVARGTGSMLENVSEIENMDIPYEMIYNHAKVADIGNEDIRKNGNIKAIPSVQRTAEFEYYLMRNV